VTPVGSAGRSELSWRSPETLESFATVTRGRAYQGGWLVKPPAFVYAAASLASNPARLTRSGPAMLVSKRGPQLQDALRFDTDLHSSLSKGILCATSAVSLKARVGQLRQCGSAGPRQTPRQCADHYQILSILGIHCWRPRRGQAGDLGGVGMPPFSEACWAYA
jgi:hypothetical protein